jgi:hypothetical protein
MKTSGRWERARRARSTWSATSSTTSSTLSRPLTLPTSVRRTSRVRRTRYSSSGCFKGPHLSNSSNHSSKITVSTSLWNTQMEAASIKKSDSTKIEDKNLILRKY